MSPPFSIRLREKYKMIVSEKIDWMSASFPYGTDLMRELSFGVSNRWDRIKSPIPVYRDAYQHNVMGHKILIGSSAIGSHVLFTGSVLDEFRAIEIDIPTIYKAIKSKGGKVARIDLAIDILGSNVSVEDFLVNAPNADTQLKGYKYIATGKNVETLYFGNIKSQSRKLRIYNKGIEQKRAEAWTRIEYEKRRGADKTAKAYFQSGQSIASIIKGVLDFPNWKFYQDIINAEKAQIPREQKIDEDVEEYMRLVKWINESVAPAIAKAVILEASMTENFSLDKCVTIDNLSQQIHNHLRKELRNTLYSINGGKI